MNAGTERSAEGASYGISRRFDGLSLDEARSKIVEALRAEGFGILTEIDVAATLRAKLDLGFRPYTILGACNPRLAHRALEAEPGIGLLLPCNVVVEETNGAAVVSIASPSEMFRVVSNPALEPIAREAEERLRRALDAIRIDTH